MAHRKISQLDSAGALDGSELVNVASNGANLQTTTADIAGLAIGDAATTELIRDTIGSTLVAGAGIAITPDDPANTVTIAALLTVEAEAGAAYTFVVADAGKHKRFTNAGAVTATVPLNATAAFPVGTRIRITAAGAGGVTLAPEGAVVLNSRDSALSSPGQFAVFEIEKVGTDEWDCLGDLA